jgi:hypothetical protein
VEWLLLTTVPTHTLEDAFERLGWYAARWNIEVYHRTLKSGCRIEDRRLADAESLEACLALDLVVAWRVMHLAKLGRETPEIPCTVFFEEAEWKALHCYHHRTATPPEIPPSLGEAMRMVAKIGGFLGRKGDGHPGATVLWRGPRQTGVHHRYVPHLPPLPTRRAVAAVSSVGNRQRQGRGVERKSSTHPGKTLATPQAKLTANASSIDYSAVRDRRIQPLRNPW